PALLKKLLALEVAYRRRHGEEPKPEDYLPRFPELDPAWVRRITAGQPPADVGPPAARAFRIRCPHCHNPIQLHDDRADQVLCRACGSSFRVRETRQTTTTATMRRLGKFQLLDRVGVGAFGAVWRARDTELGRVVALKIPHAGSLTDEAELERFHREAR